MLRHAECDMATARMPHLSRPPTPDEAADTPALERLAQLGAEGTSLVVAGHISAGDHCSQVAQRYPDRRQRPPPRPGPAIRPPSAGAEALRPW